jgi:hypothetical protein
MQVVDLPSLSWEMNADPKFSLRITVSKADQKALQLARLNDPSFHSDVYLWEALGYMVANGMSDSIQPSDVGALTDAPMLCEYNADDGSPRGCFYAYMNYAIRSPLSDLADAGECYWQFGGFIDKNGKFWNEEKEDQN